MRNRAFVSLLLASFLFAMWQSDCLAQSSFRGSRARPRPGGSMGRPSRMGAPRSSVRRAATPGGILNSVRYSPRTPGARSTTGITRRRGLPPRGAGPRPAGRSQVATGYSASRHKPGSYKPKTAPASATTLASTNPREVRTWTDSTGKYTIQGRLETYRKGVVWIRRADGRLAKVALTQLSQADQVVATAAATLN